MKATSLPYSLSPSAAPFARPSRCSRAFTLVEMLVVMGIIVVLMALMGPAMNALKSANDVTKAAYDIIGVLDNARAYAMSNNTYVYVGFEEVDASVSESKTPQTAATANAGGRLAIATIAMKDGTRGYEYTSTIANPAWSAYNKGTGFIAIGKLVRIENIHMAQTLPLPANGNMLRPSVSVNYRLGDPAANSITPFAWPLGSDLVPAQAQYYFTKVIQFDPQGIARIQLANNPDTIVTYMEIGLQETHGNAVPPPPANANMGRQVALQLDCMTGSVRVYRP